MAVKHLNYLNLTQKQRQDGAKQGRERIQSLLRSPFLTGDQAIALQKQLERLDNWENGTIPAPKTPVNHTVEVRDAVSVEEKTA